MQVVVVVCFLALVQANGSSLGVGDSTKASSPFWPQPTAFSLGTTEIQLSSSFIFKQTQKHSDLLQRGLERYHKIYNDYQLTQNESGALTSCDVNVDTVERNNRDEKMTMLGLDIDESYGISISEDGKCQIHSATVWGALHGLETFSQLLIRVGDDNNESMTMTMNYAPVSVTNVARFAHRGVLLDSARHFLPMKTLKTMIDSLTMANFNVMHWHVEDAQSFPLDTPSSPEMVKGAFQPSDVYSMDDVKELDNYAADRGIRIVYEIDGPGHAASWAKGYPHLVNDKCAEEYAYDVNLLALNPTLDETYEVLTGILKDIKAATDTKFMHLGGDEVEYGCWEADDSITQYMEENGIATYPELLGVFVDKAEKIATALDTTSIQWEDTFMAGIRPPTSTIFDVWTNSTNIKAVTDAGYRVIAAPQNYWYLDHASNTWDVMYSYDPQEEMTPAQKELIIGGEASMWGEKVDQYNIQSKVWPTAAAVGERLWSAANNTLVANIDDAELRLNTFICRMNSRGFYAGPIEPGYCATKYV